MWMFALAIAWGESTDTPAVVPTSADIHAKMDDAMLRAMRGPVRTKSKMPTVVPCPQEECRRINHTQQEAYNKVLETGWLSMANRYDVGPTLLPNPESTEPRRFLTWSTDFRTVHMLIESRKPTSYYATWTLESLTPTANPFVSNRLQPLQQTIDRWLSQCNRTRPIDVDRRQNEWAWSGTDCNGWNLWIEYNPTEERALSVLAVQQ